MIGLLLTIILGILLTTQFDFLETIELKAYDIRAGLRQDPNPAQEISLVVIDDDSITKIGRWPWSRRKFAEIIEKLSKAGAKIIALSVIFSEPERNTGLTVAKDLKKRYEELGLNKIKRAENRDFHQSLTNIIEEMNSDAELAQAIQKAHNVILPMYFTIGRKLQGNSEEEVNIIPDYIVNQAYLSIGNTEHLSFTNLPPTKDLTTPIPEFSQAARGIGHININIDPDGTTRSERLVMGYLKDYYPPLSVQIARQYTGLEMDEIRVMFGKGIRLGKTFIPTDSDMKMLISYNGPNRTFPYFSFYDVITEKIDMSKFKNKIVIIGPTASGIYHALATPASTNFPRVEYEANVVQNLLHQNYIWRPSWMGIVELGFLIFFGIFSSVALPKLGVKWGAILSLVILVSFITGAAILFVAQGIWLKIVYPSLLLILSYTIITTRHFFVSEHVKEKVEAESAETNKMLGLSFQGQGMLDMAFEKFRKCPVDAPMKNLLYNLALNYERKRQFNKAQAVYEYILAHDNYFKDIQARIERLKVAGKAIILAPGGKTGVPADQTVMTDSADKPTLGRYEVVEELGKGAMGVVYKGMDPKIGRIVAIKTIRFDQDFEPDQVEEMKERFFAEAKAAGRLNHPNIITIYDTGEDYDLSWIAMEFLEGENLEPYTKKEKLLPLRRVVEIIAHVCDALEYAHQHNIIHRDIKPANIMLLKNGDIKVTDFGIARITSASKTQTGIILGTPSYMSPEQVAGKKVDGRSDIFSLGVFFYELLTGEKPFQGESIATLMYQIANERHSNPKLKNERIPDVFVKIIDKALEKNLEKRYQKAGELGKHCKAIIQKIDQMRAVRLQSSS
ncbi:MAG: CHASE2 domain-containing protein [Deltaproteobacteria bacterium]|nr:CHASE2 domain-containing protein [Deltaproteobacteria bacterium]MBW2308841.1 CHASE2 domain-containing protein [Deltaproteobacteria bacterium]